MTDEARIGTSDGEVYNTWMDFHTNHQAEGSATAPGIEPGPKSEPDMAQEAAEAAAAKTRKANPIAPRPDYSLGGMQNVGQHPLTTVEDLKKIWSDPEQRKQLIEDVGTFGANPGHMGGPPLLGIFGGRFHPARQIAAEALEKTGASRETIKAATGIERSYQKAWAFEFNDSEATFNHDALIKADKGRDFSVPDDAIFWLMRNGTKYNKISKEDPITQAKIYGWQGTPRWNTIKLSELLDHPELYKKYPELKNLDVEPRYVNETWNGRSHSPINEMFGDKPKVELNMKVLANAKPEYIKEILFHELQHQVAGHDLRLAGSDQAFTHLYRDRVEKSYVEKWKSDPESFAAFADYYNSKAVHENEGQNRTFYGALPRDVNKVTKDQLEQLATEKFYMDQASEVQAENVVNRLDMTATERKHTLERTTEDIPYEHGRHISGTSDRTLATGKWTGYHRAAPDRAVGPPGLEDHPLIHTMEQPPTPGKAISEGSPSKTGRWYEPKNPSELAESLHDPAQEKNWIARLTELFQKQGSTDIEKLARKEKIPEKDLYDFVQRNKALFERAETLGEPSVRIPFNDETHSISSLRPDNFNEGFYTNSGHFFKNYEAEPGYQTSHGRFVKNGEDLYPGLKPKPEMSPSKSGGGDEEPPSNVTRLRPHDNDNIDITDHITKEKSTEPDERYTIEQKKEPSFLMEQEEFDKIWEQAMKEVKDEKAEKAKVVDLQQEKDKRAGKDLEGNLPDEHHPLNFLLNWLQPTKNAYAEALAKQKETLQSRMVGGDRNKYPETYQIKDVDVPRELKEHADLLAEQKEKWRLEGHEPGIFELEFRSWIARHEELQKRMEDIKKDPDRIRKALDESIRREEEAKANFELADQTAKEAEAKKENLIERTITEFSYSSHIDNLMKVMKGKPNELLELTRRLKQAEADIKAHPEMHPPVKNYVHSMEQLRKRIEELKGTGRVPPEQSTSKEGKLRNIMEEGQAEERAKKYQRMKELLDEPPNVRRKWTMKVRERKKKLKDEEDNKKP